MELNYENTLIEEFKKLDCTQFKVHHITQHIFICGGIVDIRNSPPQSFRHEFIEFTARESDEIHSSIVLAENFKDYFKDNIFENLLIFEEYIADIASLILIFLESPGSLVELGMFCNKESYYKKLLIVAPQDKLKEEDSFIFLGPIQHIQKLDNSSIQIYPWPDSNQKNSYSNHLINLLSSTQEKLDSIQKTSNFNKENTLHIFYLIYEIVRLSYPILITEIKKVLKALSLELDENKIKSHLYLLKNLGIIKSISYSSYKFYYPIDLYSKAITFGKNKDGKISDSQSIQMEINHSYILKNNDNDRKRRTAKEQINIDLSEK